MGDQKAERDGGARHDPVKTPRQSRSAKTQARILTVVETLLSEGAFAEASVHEIASRAGCSVGGFYRRFANKDAALFKFQEARFATLVAQTGAILRPAGDVPLRDALAAFADFIIEHTFKNAALARAGAGREAVQDGPVAEIARQANAEIYASMSALLAARASEHGHSDPGAAAQFVIALTAGLSRDAVLYGRALATRRVSPDAFRGELKRAVFGYLGMSDGA